MNKGKQREEMKNTLAGLSKEQYDEKSRQIHQALFSSAEWERARIVGVTVSRMPEVDTIPIIEQAWLEQKLVAVPKCYPRDKSMKFFLLRGFDELETVYFGLKEPDPTRTKPCEKSAIDLILVPGLVFDKRGYRIGFGGGYYDRFLTDYTGKTVSLAFKEQVKDELEHESYDIPVSTIMTDESTYDCIAGE
ncbi:5-formyltetrahydrofolate cyclo-ligase [Bacillus tianshenii]|uniref:5-formyltetrahydrofolate cyclo-ligase n=1 Tax=Sutcliffiella tianshenii TaxID=1463404 RepID=A0ABS2NZT6_9BACI|nr:5-formyltetrahydrofolate cyclo-ligase [Bacillus tianshenii]MBM7620232.1 5-formyltetrahydrofolate cyclo-ligase [Bacillus tianshenii]